MDPPIRRLAAAEAPALAALGEACFREAYGEHFSPVDMDTLCAAVFAPPVMDRLLAAGVWVAGDWQGYIALGETPCPIPGLASPTVELARLYVRRCWQGKGVADRLMERFLEEVTRLGSRGVWLQAFAGNPRALAFYRRWGFRDLGACAVVCEGIALPHRTMGRDLDQPSRSVRS